MAPRSLNTLFLLLKHYILEQTGKRENVYGYAQKMVSVQSLFFSVFVSLTNIFYAACAIPSCLPSTTDYDTQSDAQLY